ncbi:serine/threonine-protein kinase mTOR isoform X1 [Schistocerca americana]|uniref:serine/threonine-protein kinase mTOR isoform X1 n=1 Tax=Schistocerca americana TaxID=7009 RepID=UPI001F4FAF95|nr:serine/threonine-protein kinase mTOR isoform X1 [Schistocerca americana]XP_047105802.1 serine/threonine-protein kinase mTOR isoform X1 [Schistocerca piceifrons]XP_049773846.1 serine/threonine-protein kinase mTOR isoform X1 [Schistocerca cancellata]XP_049802723.1 serine/threonine-protein kinase mTOR isoform X1 [Schistocerca nitens]
MSNTLMQQFVTGLKSRHHEVRFKAARDLYHYVKTELREVSVEEQTSFMDEFNHHIFEMVSGSDVNEKKGGILAIVCLINADVGNMNTRVSRFANYLRNLLPSNDTTVMELAAKTVGKLALVSGTYAAEYVEFEVKRAFEWLSGDRQEGKRLAAVLVLRELAVSMPTYFFQQVQQFFDLIFNAIRDSKAVIREGAVEALRAALVVTTQRETAKQTQKPLWYKQCYDEAITGFEDIYTREKGVNRDDRIHGSLLVLNELLRCSNAEWERNYEGLMEKIVCQPNPQNNETMTMLLWLRSPKMQHSPLVVSLPSNNHTSLYESAACRQLMTENFDTICNAVLSQRIIRNPHIQHTLLAVLPRLSAFNRKKFVQAHLNKTMLFLLGSLRTREKDRSAAFTTVGLIAVAVQEDIQSYLPKIMDVIRASLPSKDTPSKKRAATLEPAVFVCITLLGHAVGLMIRQDVKDLLEPMLATGLSPALTMALRELAANIPQLKRDISEGLLRMLSQVLMQMPLRHPGMPRHLPSPGFAVVPLSLHAQEVPDVPSIVLALRTLGSFNFDGHSLLHFVRQCADHFLSRNEQEVRLEAVRTCSRLLHLALQGASSKHSETVTATVSAVLSKLLVVGITDTDADVRYCVLDSLDHSFDSHLAQAENLSALFVAMNDEVFEIRERAICTIGRLSSMNPAYVMPSLRKTLIQLLTELEHSGMGRNKEQASRMLDNLVVHAPRLIRHYMDPILKVLVPKLRDLEPNPGVVISVLTAIGNLAEVNGNEMQQWMPELLSILLEMLGDASSPEKRCVALWALGQLVGATGHVVKPYEQYPTLLDTLISFLKTEQQTVIRRGTIRALGLLGALDPYKHKMNLGQIDTQVESTALISMSDSKSEAESSQDLSTSEMLVNMSSSTLEEYYPAIAIATLMRIIRDPTLSQHHTMVVQAVTFIFKSLGIKCVPYISQVMPSFLNVVRTADVNFREFLFQQLAVLIAIVRQHIRNYLDDIFTLIKEFWTINSPLQTTLILLAEHIAVALGAEFKIYLPQLMPQILRVLAHDVSKDRAVTVKLLNALQKFGNNLDDYLHLILPPVVRLFDAPDCPTPVRRCALETVDHLADTLDFSDFASRIIHPLVRTLDSSPELRATAMETLCSLVTQLGRKYQIFIPLVQKVIAKHKIYSQRYELLTCKIVTLAKPLCLDMWDDCDLDDNLVEPDDSLLFEPRLSRPKRGDVAHTSSEPPPIKRLHVSPANLQRAWTATRRVSKDDWLEWLRRLSIELLKESPSPALRSCWALAQTYSQLPRDLFNAAFVSCWTELSKSLQDELIQSLEQALMVPDLPEITQTILNLAEFMEHCDKGPLPLDPQLLGERAMHCRAYAKALHYKEDEFHKEPNNQVFEALISINNKLQQKEAAAGLLEYVMNHQGADLKVQERWYEKLHNWEKALISYEERLDECPGDVELALGQMRCLEALGEWGQLHEVARKNWNHFDEDGRQRMSRMAAASAWGLGQWEAMEQFVACVPRDSQDGAFYRAVLAVHREQYHVAQQLIDSARDLLDTELTAMAGESYQRAYGAMVSVQMLAELEEVIQYKLVPERRPTIRKMWWDRLQGCQRVVEDWQRIIQVRTLVVSPQEDMYTWLKYASLCRKSGRLMLSHKTLVMLLGVDPSQNSDQPLPTHHPQVTFAYTKHMWMSGKREEAYNHLKQFVQTWLNPQAMQMISPEDQKQQQLHRRLLARCYLKLGQWHEAVRGINQSSIITVLNYYASATEHDPNWYKAWHAWAYMNYETVLFYTQQQKQGGIVEDESVARNSGLQASDYITQFTVPAVEGFFRSIALSHGSSLQDTLRLLTLWFDYGQCNEVYEALVEGIRTIDIDTWLQVIPQLIARIDTPRVLVGRLIHHLLIDIGKKHPQALVYPLTVATKSASLSRRNAANKILNSMREHSSLLVSQAILVSDELIRVAILWHELWHEGLEEASRLYFGERNVKGMFDTLEPLHAMLERGPQTHKETSFNQAYGRDLMEAQEWCHRYKVSGNVRDLNQAWDLYYHVFRRISRQLPQLTSLELQYVSHKLLLCRDQELAVPGSYVPNQPIVRIAYINSSLQVITSKQRPRKLCIRGSNGKDYMFLLKGHEDLRQDERVMQLFGLVNTLLLNDPDTFRRNLTIQRYAVIPLSTNSGLIGWVPHCDTLHTLIRDYREKKKILLNIEHRIMLRMAPDYDHLTLMQKVEVFEHALEHTQGDDLSRLLWLKSPSSEVWFDRRTNYTRSLAVMSMVGYILGLGDRHPSNLMLDRLSGKILHIDFGDCFEVAMTREKFPEKIPFRLTRMLINAMEVTGIEGTYRRTCESVMSVLHRNKDSLMAVLEAFVYDPLLNWRLIDNATPKAKRSKAQTDLSVSSSSQEHGDILDAGGSLSATAAKKGVPGSMENIGDNNQPEALNKKALAIITRVREKLTGCDFSHEKDLTVQKQVDLLIQQATSNENLCQCYIGWCPFW